MDYLSGGGPHSFGDAVGSQCARTLAEPCPRVNKPGKLSAPHSKLRPKKMFEKGDARDFSARCNAVIRGCREGPLPCLGRRRMSEGRIVKVLDINEFAIFHEFLRRAQFVNRARLHLTRQIQSWADSHGNRDAKP